MLICFKLELAFSNSSFSYNDFFCYAFCVRILIRNIIFICLGNVYQLLRDSLCSVQNPTFIHIFKENFLKDQLTPNKHYLKEIQSQHNPLFRLMNIDKQNNKQNILVKDLIALTTSLIEINENDTFYNTFHQPSRETLTYAVLFDESLNSLPIHTQTIKYLNTQWKKWEKEGVLATDIYTWKRFTPEQIILVRKIWTLVSPAAGNKYQFDALFDANHQDMKIKLEMNEKVVTCLTTYCEQAIDKIDYHTEVQSWYSRFERENVKLIKIPKILENIIPFAERLNPYADVHCWRTFLARRTTINGKIWNYILIFLKIV